MKRDWEGVDGEKKGRSSREAKRSHEHMLLSFHLFFFQSKCFSSFVQKEATGDSATKLEGEK